MKHKLYFRKSALSGAKKLILEHNYFGIKVADNEYYYAEKFSDRLEYELFKMVSEVWIKRKSSKIFKIKFLVDKDSKRLLRLIVRHCRNSWYALKDGNDLLAKYEFKCAEAQWLRFGLGQMTNIASTYIMKASKASSDGSNSIKKRWKNNGTSNAQRDKRIKEAIREGAAIEEIAQSYGITTRRVQQIKNT